MNKLVLSLSIVAFMAFAGIAQAASGTYGDNNCQPVYGGGETCIITSKFILDKKVLHPTRSKGGADIFVDNLTLNDPRFSPTQNVKFQLSVTNTGDSTINELTLSDTLPSYIDFVSAPSGFSANGKVITYQVRDLKADETRRFEIVGKISGKLPQGQNAVCVVNQASLETGNDKSTDNSQLCIEKTPSKGGLPIMPAPKMSQTPSTGPEMLPLFGLIPAAAAGLLLRKRSSK